jgi:MFS family permease
MERTQIVEDVEMTVQPSDDPERNNRNLDLAHTKSLENQVSLPRECLVVTLISLAMVLTQSVLGQTVVLSHIIADHYNITEPGVISWFVAGYSLTVGTFILFSGRLGDVFGWKQMLVFGYVWFGVWSIISGLAWYSNHVLFIFTRVFAGIGASICLPNGLAMLGALYQPGKRKNMAFAVFGGCAPAGAISGIAVAGLFNLAWWPCEYLLGSCLSSLMSTPNRGFLVHRPCIVRYGSCGFLCGT